jgi:hypothetical protein
MASGDITKVQTLGRVLLPGGGQTLTGKKVQNKVMTWGKITCTYVSTGVSPGASGSQGGGNLTLPDLVGVATLDFIELTLNWTDGADAANSKIRTFQYDTDSDLIFGLENIGYDNASGAAAPTDGDALDLRWLAVGDAPDVADLT